MAVIRLGPAGIPISAKGGSSVEGVKRCAELGLNAMELEFVRGVKMSIDAAKEVGAVAKQLDVALSVHAPYFINLTSAEKAKASASERMIIDTLSRASAMDATVIAVHAGWYGKMKSEEATECMKEKFLKLAKFSDHVKIGIETTGRMSQWGTVDEILQVCKAVPQCVPVIDWAHLYARAGGQIDYPAVLDKVKRFRHLHCHFEGIKFSSKAPGTGNEISHTPINHHPPFEPLAKEILKRKIDVTIIAEGPTLEADALKMKRIFERLGHKF
ncbi:MAG: TIM barrel protein [Candidatus Aenigmarchaeota archaeon]|nr:TIM barrel protein [Candidatus Aenigmarchaeota archaeon]